MSITLFIIAFIASTIGAISGVGGGVIIKPILDSLGMMNISTINFLSGCTVLSMAISSCIRNTKTKSSHESTTIILAIGASFGGVLGKWVFNSLSGNLSLLQSFSLLIVNTLVLIYMLNKHKIKSFAIINPIQSMLIGLGLGAISAFLGIGGGPINIAALFYFFSMEPKKIARNSLIIILFSQITSLSTTIITGAIPEFDISYLFLMSLGGILGAILGGRFSKLFSNKVCEIFFISLLIFLIILNIYNTIHMSIL